MLEEGGFQIDKISPMRDEGFYSVIQAVVKHTDDEVKTPN